ncbi:hypothetical protein D3C80_2181690 [compost metagenome]
MGDEEKIYNAEKVVKCVQETLPNSEAMIIRGAGHCLILEQKPSVNEAIRGFISKPQ